MQQQQQHEEQLSIQQPSSSNGVPAVAPKQKADTGWYYAVGLSAMAALICSVDRAAISVAILPMSEQYGWSDSTKGAINRCVWSRSVIQREHLTEGASLGAGQGVQYNMSRTERATMCNHQVGCAITCPSTWEGSKLCSLGDMHQAH
mgnify:CR=1 FL=1